ncbi:hypothetical protein A3B21_03925 [Candidatus Uhrbacteria bacterium RIFCSPLOWO2_01_FULL_47_24]|uniref:Type II secretion system protein GspG C-terminal domain-containing protein n=1 Tax=Candidatus Uhrbacteria bacterium RIFCSPLOWO2_01_FULL_47_24 TaxID=1802401 RepID=A0A1F7UT58_9BACT|nr:MAG: hypothetical protein A2753_00670 [Candidatus Uhrbacteria bacterium RIFCSPHIGHO2_01_FULL_47_11]OGL69119.1 MAG: hypothetical protein A3D58_02625 [Candidatus Uhrbacteria bacterium RIFCSPHIGHO2_02_FULL_46_47]OGL75730.1 MAG: hypothetical protein A3F52_02350 [Candidatus Uhrbacteria bacterium RIFCSPHIGHO2_12_FULL_47_11]OGL81490.1 MAG: hypothetical protein A3B21_03925 [Candidatus Uhrbacteria bacterium RIFCSPLOWO2_01_FULL_47_24]OGL83735.1 MAG: hypothetical protein A3J03_01380 [Candidatus Uhrbact
MKKISGLHIFVSIIIAAVIAVTIVGLYIAGAPGKQRLRRFDDGRINDLQQLSFAIQAYFDRADALPASFADLQGRPDYYIRSTTDTETGISYEYQITGAEQYELCATFNLPSLDTAADAHLPKSLYGSADFWKHDAGRACFSFNLKKNTR